jgi:hypothetical protein
MAGIILMVNDHQKEGQRRYACVGSVYPSGLHAVEICTARLTEDATGWSVRGASLIQRL